VPIEQGTLYGGRVLRLAVNDPFVVNVSSATFVVDTGLPAAGAQFTVLRIGSDEAIPPNQPAWSKIGQSSVETGYHLLPNGNSTGQPPAWNGSAWIAATNLAVPGELSVEAGTSYTAEDTFTTTDATPHDTTIVASIPTDSHGHYDVTAWVSGVVATSGASVCLAKRYLISVADDGSTTERVDNADVGDQYDGITVGGIGFTSAGTPGVLKFSVTGKVSTTIKWNLKFNVMAHLVAHESGA
jgi:hypothetical protein